MECGINDHDTHFTVNTVYLGSPLPGGNICAQREQVHKTSTLLSSPMGSGISDISINTGKTTQ